MCSATTFRGSLIVVAGASATLGTVLVAPLSTLIKVLSTCFAGLGVVSVEGVRDFSARCLSCSAAAAVMGVGFGRGRLPGLDGDESFVSSGWFDERLDGFDGLAKFAGVMLLPATGDTAEVSVEGLEACGGDSAIK